MKLLTLSSFVIIISGCTNQTLGNSQITYDNVATIATSELKESKKPLQIATWSPTKYNGRYTAMVSGYLVKFNNCLALSRNAEEMTTKDNAYLLVLSDDSFSWDNENEILMFEGKPYKIGDELYLGGGVFTYPNGRLTGEDIKLNWIECGLDKGWLGG